MAVTLTCPRCTRTTTLLDTDPVACPFCAPLAKPKPRRRPLQVYVGDPRVAREWAVVEVVFVAAVMAFFVFVVLGGVASQLGLLR